jgi:hypothetical protein
MKLVFTEKLPDKPGYYYYTNFGEHTPCVLKVKMDYSTNTLWASNEEYTFEIKPKKEKQRELFSEYKEDIIEGKYKFGDELWCYIPDPYLPGGEKQIKPDCY